MNNKEEKKLNQESLDNRLHIATLKDNFDLVKALVLEGADVNTRDGITLRMTTFTGNLNLMKFLINNGANVSEKYELELACQEQHLHIVKFLIIELNKKVEHGITYLNSKNQIKNETYQWLIEYKNSKDLNNNLQLNLTTKDNNIKIRTKI